MQRRLDHFLLQVSILNTAAVELESRYASIRASCEIIFRLADDGTRGPPPRQLGFAALLAQLVERWPVHVVVVLKVHVAGPVGAPQLLRGDVLLHVFVELELLPRDGVDEGCDDFEKAPDNPRNCKAR